MKELWGGALSDPLNKFVNKVLTFLPNLLAMAAILIVGFVVAWVIRKALFRFLEAVNFDRMSQQWGLTGVLSGGAPHSPALLLSRFIYWIIVTVTLTMGLNALELSVTQTLITRFFNYLPHLFVGIVILIVGYLIAAFLGQAVLISAVNAKIESARVLSTVARWLITVLALTMALYHLGIAEKVIVAAFSIFFGGIVLSLAIAFGWGGRELARDFIERLYGRKEKKDGEKDKISHI
jgi:hypothetical protein